MFTCPPLLLPASIYCDTGTAHAQSPPLTLLTFLTWDKSLCHLCEPASETALSDSHVAVSTLPGTQSPPTVIGADLCSHEGVAEMTTRPLRLGQKRHFSFLFTLLDDLLRGKLRP